MTYEVSDVESFVFVLFCAVSYLRSSRDIGLPGGASAEPRRTPNIGIIT
jgi:hypothetical protein